MEPTLGDGDKLINIFTSLLPSISYLYWTDWGTKPKIERAQLNSHGNAVSNRRAIVSSGLGWPNGLCIDERDQLLYWGDALRDTIELSDLLVSICTLYNISIGPQESCQTCLVYWGTYKNLV